MADLRIVDTPLLSTVKGTEKIPTGGEGNFSVSVNQVADFAKLKWFLATEEYVDNAVGNVQDDLDLHKNDSSNPHGVTKAQVGLGNVDNTADLDKPVSNASIASLSLKADKITTYTKTEVDSEFYGIYQNGASLPYDATMEYAENAHVVKDGELQKKQGAAWVSATNKGYNLDYFVGGKSYPLYAEIMLENGDIVKSTVANNTVDPDMDMAGWVKTNAASQVFQSNGLSQESRNSQDPTILDFFTKPELDNFSTNPEMDCTEIIKRAFAAGSKRINFLDLQMHITKALLTEDPLATFTSGDIILYGNGATFIDDTVYTDVSNPSFNSLFILDGGVNSFNSNIDYTGKPVNLNTKLGYVGATYVYSKHDNKNIYIDADLENIRYGILCGNYALPELGGTKGVRGWLRCKNVGYPISSYLADDIEIKITGDGFHRVSYIAGARHARVYAQTKNYYIAQVACLFTDAKTGDGTSRGCSDAKVFITDMGSTQYVPNSYLSGISLSRVDAGTKYDGVELNATLVASDTVASKLGHSIINSTVKSIIPEQYPLNWTTDISLSGIKISGLIDRSDQTTEEHSFGELYMLTEDGAANFAQVSQIDVSDLEYRPGTGTKPRSFYMLNRGLKDKAFFNNVNFPNNAPFLYGSNNTSMTYFDKCKIRGLSTDSTDQLPNTTATFDSCDIYGGTSYIDTNNKTFLNTPIGSIASSAIKTISSDLTLAGASVQWAAAIPINSVVLGVRVKLLSNITGSSGFTVGDNATPAKFFNSNAVVSGTVLGVSNMPASTVPYTVDGTKNIVVTSKVAGFTGGTIRIVVDYINMPAL